MTVDVAPLDEDDDAEKLKRPIKLLVGDKVEVRSRDEGLMGSWHTGVVINSENGARKVQYDNVLCDDGSQKFSDYISIHPVIDGAIYVGRKRLYYRGFIRPFPPFLDFDKLSIQYGQCVDAYYKEAWWEGVVFDHEISSNVRSIFFPDIGDLLRVDVDSLRITQDWDEYTHVWKPRGNWYFLELVEQFEKEIFIAVSVRQIWYEVREKKAFSILKEWTNSILKRDVWGSLVKEVIYDHSKLAAEKYYGEFVESMLPGDFEHQPERNHAVEFLSEIHTEEESKILKLSGSKSATDEEEFPGPFLINNHDENITGRENCKFPEAEICVDFVNKSETGGRINLINVSNSDTTHEKVPCEQVSSNKRGKRKWESAGTDLVPVAEFCPDSFVEYRNICLGSKKSGTPLNLALNMRKHLAYLGWKVEICRENGHKRMRYVSPNGKYYMSLATVCKDLDTSFENENTSRPFISKTEDNSNEALNNLNSLNTACEAYADGEADESAKEDIISELRQNIKVGDEASGILLASQSFPSIISNQIAESSQAKYPPESGHLIIDVPLIASDIDGTGEIKVVPLVSEQEETHRDIISPESNTEEGKKLNIIHSSRPNPATHVKGLPGALSIDHKESFNLQGSNITNGDFCSISEIPAEKNEYCECQITETSISIAPEAKICQDPILKSKMEGISGLDLISNSKSETTHEETPCSSPSIISYNAAEVNGFSGFEKLNIAGKELSSKKRKKRNWEIAGSDIVPEAEFCPDSVTEYLKCLSSKNHKITDSLRLNMRKHLAYMGWKSEICREEGFQRMRYTSPSGKSYMSLATVCKNWDYSIEKIEGKKGSVPSPSSNPLPSPLPQEVIEPAIFPETKSADMENTENNHYLFSGSLISKEEALKIYNFVATECEVYADSEVESTGDMAIISERIQNIEVGGVEVNDVPLVTEKEKINVDLYLSKSNIEEGKKSELSLSNSSASATHVVGFSGAPSINYNKSFSSQGSNSIRDDFFPILEKPVEKRDYYGCKIAGYNVDIVPEAEISQYSIYKSKMEGEKRFDLISSSNSGTTHEEAPCSLLSIRHCNAAAVDEFSNLEDLNIIGKEFSIKKRKGNWEISGNDVVPETESCLYSVTEYRKSPNFEMEICREEGFSIMHYEKKSNISPATVCKDPDTSTEQGEEKKSSPPPLDVVENADFSETVKHYNLFGSEENEKNLAVGEHHNEGTDDVSYLNCNSLAEMNVKITGCSEKNEKKEFALIPSAKLGGDMDNGEKSVMQLASSLSFHGTRPIFSLLIDNGVLFLGAKVYYRKKSGDRIKEGQVTREGIKCNCCQNIFGLSKFEAHAGSTYHRPAANIFLEDGRSISECQSQLRCRDNLKQITALPPQLKRKIATPPPQPKSSRCNIKKIASPLHQSKRSRGLSKNDYICSVCNLGGPSTFCDNCPSSFHQECLGLKVIPEGEWFCPSCCCGICGNNKFNSGAKRVMDGSTMNCYQCERQYHVGCVWKQGDANMNRGINGKWFCNEKCEQIFLGLRKLLGKPVVVGDGNLTWTLLKYTPCNDQLDDDGIDSMEILKNLRFAESVMHECFDPVKESRTKTDIIKDVIFSRGSHLKRLNFQGFYMVLLSRDEELYSVAAVRVYGEKVAEVPLIGTRFEYRRQGICRLLMNVLEKKLMELGVERVVFLATPGVLSTWTSSFGFSKSSKSERLNLLNYTFLDFLGTAMCHKILTKSAPPINFCAGTQQKSHHDVGGSNNGDFNKNCESSELFQSEKTDVNIIHQGTVDVALPGSGANGGNRTSSLILRV